MPRKAVQLNYHPVTLRLPQPLIDDVRTFSQETGVPINTAMIQFLERGLAYAKEEHRASIARAWARI